MNKDLEQAITNKLRNISSRLNNHHAQYYKLLDELCQTIADIKECEKVILDAFKQELVGRSLSDGLSDKQLLLADALDALAVGMEELRIAYKRMKGVSKSLDGLEETEKAISCLVEVLGMGVEERRPKKGSPPPSLPNLIDNRSSYDPLDKHAHSLIKAQSCI